jgi:predicted DNA binding CopG/RHH family protein
MKQTAVEWVFDELDEQVFRIDHVERRINISISFEDMMTLKKEAKEMEKEQRIMDYNAGHSDGLCNHINDADNYINEQYYNETYGNE